MDEIKMEEDVVSVDVIDPIDNSDLIIAHDETERADNNFSDVISVSNSTLETGNLFAQVFKLIASLREKTYWELDNKEIKSLNTTCPKILPKILSEHAGIISCILSLLSIIMKRLKREQLDGQSEKNDINKNEKPIEELKGLTGGRTK